MASPKIRIGPSGFSYDDWHGPFYPPSVRPQYRLEYYAQHFNPMEVNDGKGENPSEDGGS